MASFTREQLDRFLKGATGDEAMGGSKSPGAGGQTAVAQEVEKLLRKNPEMFEKMLDKKPKKFSGGGRTDTKKKPPKTPKISSDPESPSKMGGDKLLQQPYKRNISRNLGTEELPVGAPVPNRMIPPMRSQSSGKNLVKKFSLGGRSGDVRDNSNRGTTY